MDTILAGFNRVLKDLQFIVVKYQSLGTNERSAWDQMKFGTEDIAEIRNRLVINMSFLTTFMTNLSADMINGMSASFVNGTTTTNRDTLPRREHGSWQWVADLPGLDRSFSRSETDTTTLVDVPSPPSTSRPRFPSFASGSSNGKKRPISAKQLISAIDKKKFDKALEALNEESTIRLDQESLDHALWAAACFPSIPLMEALLERGANVDAVRKEKNVLWNAVNADNEDVVRFLLSKKVNLKIDHLSHNALPLRAALKLRSSSMMSLLARNGAPINAEYQVSSTLRLNILQEAITQKQDSIAQILLDNGATVDACSPSRGTALMIALSIGREAIAKILIQAGADVNATRSASGSCTYTNPVEAAILGGKASLLELVFRAGAVTNMTQAMRFARTNSDYPLNPHAASQYGNDCEGTRRLYEVMVMLAQRDLRYVLFFRKNDRAEVKMKGIWKMMDELKT